MGQAGHLHGVSGDQPNPGVLVRWEDVGASPSMVLLGRFTPRYGQGSSSSSSSSAIIKATQKPSPTRGVPGHRSTPALAHVLLARELPEHLEVFALLHLPLPKPLIVCAITRAGGKPEARAVPDSDTGQTRGAALHPGVPRLPHRSMSPSPAAPFPAPARRPGQQELCWWHVRAQVCPSRSALSTCSTKHPPKQALTSGLGVGMLAGGLEMSTLLQPGGQTQSPYSPGLPQGSHRKKSCFMQLRNFLSTHHRFCSGPCFCILTRPPLGGRAAALEDFVRRSRL